MEVVEQTRSYQRQVGRQDIRTEAFKGTPVHVGPLRAEIARKASSACVLRAVRGTKTTGNGVARLAALSPPLSVAAGILGDCLGSYWEGFGTDRSITVVRFA